MTDMDPRQAGMDRLLRRSLDAPTPSLPADFERRVLRALRPRRRMSARYRRNLLAGYGAVSAVTSAVIMRGEGLQWSAIAAMLLAALVVAAAVPRVRRAA